MESIVIFRRRGNDEPEDDEEELEQVLFQGAVNGIDADLKANAKLVQVGLVRAKELVSEAMARRAEMIRVDTKGQAAMAVLFVDGVPYPAGKMPAQAALAITQMLKLLAGLDIKVRDKPQSGGIHAEYSEKKYVVKVDAVPAAGGPERLIVRIEDPKIRLEKPHEIGLNEALRGKIRDYTSEREGVVLAAGPPMSGVSTTAIGIMRSVDAYLYSIFNLADLGGRDLAHVTDFKRNEGENLVQWITRAKRQECDVIFVDPLRDAETTKTIFDEADDRSFVSETAAKDAADAITRVVAWIGDPKIVADRLKLVICQKLIRKLCPECRQAYRPNPKLIAKVGLPPETKVLYRVPRPVENEKGEVEEPDDCPKCGNIGYFGRMALFEAIEMTDEIKKLVVQGADATALKAAARGVGMQGFQKDGLAAVAEGKTSLEELQRVFSQK
ncbi:MAG: Flp pilus assembly complex ATPase component TadA [Planctomycetaceae bacterium]|nr:Flp pilus assembly complex ATPase component TadA [Planctomycetaceae bacterium]